MKLIDIIENKINDYLVRYVKTWYWLATNTGIPKGTITDIKYKKNKSLNLSTLITIIRALGITVAEFFDDKIFEEMIEGID